MLCARVMALGVFMPDHWRYAVGVGSNLGDRQANIATGRALLDAGGIGQVELASDMMESAAVGGPTGQGTYLNGVWIILSAFGPHQVLAELQRIESRCGRVRTVRWGPRTLDLDLLMRDDGLVVASSVLSLPHPRIAERPFVLIPLRQVATGWPSLHSMA
jgi:2-amino-4-hydroxy-6-hydroxymethyldihydropteridine diphosphokinase